MPSITGKNQHSGQVYRVGELAHLSHCLTVVLRGTVQIMSWEFYAIEHTNRYAKTSERQPAAENSGTDEPIVYWLYPD